MPPFLIAFWDYIILSCCFTVTLKVTVCESCTYLLHNILLIVNTLNFAIIYLWSVYPRINDVCNYFTYVDMMMMMMMIIMIGYHIQLIRSFVYSVKGFWDLACLLCGSISLLICLHIWRSLFRKLRVGAQGNKLNHCQLFYWYTSPSQVNDAVPHVCLFVAIAVCFG